MSNRPPISFVAYPSSDESLKNIINEAISRANTSSNRRFESWEFNDIPGAPLISPILSRIDESEIVIADITYLNLNVVYEIGFTIGRKKRAFLIRHSGTQGDKEIANETGIFDTLGYFEYHDHTALRDRLTAHLEDSPLPFEQSLDTKAPVYIVEPLTHDTAATLAISRMKKSGYRIRSFNPAEDIRLSATDAIRQVSKSSGILTILQQKSLHGSQAHNIRTMFVLGLAHGMRIPALTLSPAGYSAPLDIRDFVKSFRQPSDITDSIAEFCPEINSFSQELDPTPLKSSGLLQSLSVGDPTAENEMATLGKYYLQTEQYQRAVRGEVNLVVGRKGSGKTALFIEVRDKIRSDKRNIVVDLKPEGYQLLKLKEEILLHLTEGTRQHLVTAFWEYLILLEVTYKILEKDRNTYRFNHSVHDLYLELERTYKVENFSGDGDFSERLLTLSQLISTRYQEAYGAADGRKLTSREVTEILYSHDIRLLQTRVSKYLERKQSVWVLFDNLDKGWSTHGVDVIDATVLRCLIDAGRKIERHMERSGHVFHCLVFVRNDVYEHLMINSSDYGKEMRAILDWTDPDLLKKMLHLRLASGLDNSLTNIPIEQIWRNVCASHINGEESLTFIIERSLMRPRNLLKIFNHSRGFATNFNREKIDEEDVIKGLKAYSQDLIIEVSREISDVFPDAPDLIYHLIDLNSVVEYQKLLDIAKSAGLDENSAEKAIDFLLYYGVIGVKSSEAIYFIYDVHYDLKPLKIRANRAGQGAVFVINPAFWPALGIQNPADVVI